MPQNQKPTPNPNQIPKQPKDNTPPADTTTEQQPASKEIPNPSALKVVPGSLAKAVMRTFRGDVSESLGPNASQKKVDSFVPKTTEATSAQKGQPKAAAPKKRNEAVVHTFKDDVQNLVRTKKVSMTRIAAMESDKRGAAETVTEEKEPWKTTTVIALAILFLIVGSILAFGAYYAYTLNAAPNLAPQFDPAIIFTEARESIDVTGKNEREIMATLAEARRNTFFSLGSVIEFHLTNLVETADGEKVPVHLDSVDFLNAINATVPTAFKQTLGTDYVLGIHVIDENVPFLILTSESYGHTFSGMLQWERNIEEDTIPFFSPGGNFVKPAIADSENTFLDTVIQNLDVRILRDKNGDVRLLYAFTNRGTLVITNNIRTLTELSNRLGVANI